MQVLYQRVIEALLKHGVLFVIMSLMSFLLWQKISEVERKNDTCNAQFQEYLRTQVMDCNKIIEHNTAVMEEVLREIRKK